MGTAVMGVWLAALAFGSPIFSRPPDQALNFDLLYTFAGAPDAGQPSGALYRDANGNLFGTTASQGIPGSCGGPGCGTVYEVSNTGQEQVLYRFRGGADGNEPNGLTPGPDGDLYSTTAGVNDSAATLFKLDPTNGVKTILYTFSDFVHGGDDLNSAPVFDAAGNLYGAAQYGGDINCGYNGNGCGVIYKYDAGGHMRAFHTFTNYASGEFPWSGVAIGLDGTLYGSAAGGDLKCNAPGGCGVIYKLTPSGTYTVLHRFHGRQDGLFPGYVTADGSGNVYGTTSQGGDFSCYPPLGCGTIFMIDAAGRFSVLFTFTRKQICCGPGYWGLMLDSRGNIYGSSGANGAHGDGFVFKLDTKRNFTDLFDYPGCGASPDGGQPNTVIRDTTGNFYGTMTSGGDQPCPGGLGTVYELRP
jgi:uncharacterized repeat protein (TIGR03803 family)